MDFLHSFAQAPKPRWLRIILRQVVLMVLPKTIRFHGYKLVPNQEDHIMGSALLRGTYEPHGVRLFLEKVKPGMVVVDCGANIGIYTCLASGAVGTKGKVFAFEPEPRNFACLTQMIKLNDLRNVRAEQFALSDRNGEASLFLSEMNMGDHRLGEADESRASVIIPTRTLDSQLASILEQIDLLKIDVQGAEGLVFKGMREILFRSKNLKIFMEFWPYALKRSGTDPREFIQALVLDGFIFHSIDQTAGTLHKIEDAESLVVDQSEQCSFDLYLERH